MKFQIANILVAIWSYIFAMASIDETNTSFIFVYIYVRNYHGYGAMCLYQYIIYDLDCLLSRVHIFVQVVYTLFLFVIGFDEKDC